MSHFMVMAYSAGMFRVFLAVLGFGLFPISVSAQACTDVRSLDLKNATIRVGSPDESGPRMEPSELKFSLRNGVALIANTSGSSSAARQPDWRVELLIDRVVHPEPSLWLRVLVLEQTHLTGTGTWRYILALDCNDGQLERIFQFGSEGISLKHLDDQTMLVYQTMWMPADSHAQPSKHREMHYAWNAQNHRYRLSGDSALMDGAEMPPNEK